VIVAVLSTGCSAQSGSTGPARPATSSSGASIATKTTVSTTTTAPRPAYRLRHLHFSVGVSVAPGTLDVFAVVPEGRGPFPLVVYAHGSGTNAQRTEPFLDEIAREGFVVVGPNFTGTDVHQSAVEIRLTIDRIVSRGSPLSAGLVDSRYIGLVGWSLGGLTTVAVAYNSCCRDPRISAAVTIEGPFGDLPNGSYSLQRAPLLIVLGDHDFLVPPATGKQLLDRFRGAAYLLTIVGGDHGGGMDESDPAHAAVMRTILDFLHGYVGSDAGSLQRLAATPNRPHTKFAFHPPA
jgi:dienelactone hydrolase